jgi:hypothetical protein
VGNKPNVSEERMDKNSVDVTIKKITILIVIQSHLVVTRHAHLTVSLNILGKFALVFAQKVVLPLSVQNYANLIIARRISSVLL